MCSLGNRVPGPFVGMGVVILKLLWVFLLLIFSAHSLQAGQVTAGKCVGVSDGDTIRVLCNRKEIIVRLEGIDCPERGQDFGTRAQQYTGALVFGRHVQVRVVTHDRYGRAVARVLVQGKDLSVELVRAGLAWHYTRYSRDPLLAKAEKEARAKKAGLWAVGNPIPPWEFRHKKRWKVT